MAVVLLKLSATHHKQKLKYNISAVLCGKHYVSGPMNAENFPTVSMKSRYFWHTAVFTHTEIVHTKSLPNQLALLVWRMVSENNQRLNRNCSSTGVKWDRGVTTQSRVHNQKWRNSESKTRVDTLWQSNAKYNKNHLMHKGHKTQVENDKWVTLRKTETSGV